MQKWTILLRQWLRIFSHNFCYNCLKFIIFIFLNLIIINIFFNTFSASPLKGFSKVVSSYKKQPIIQISVA